MQDIWIESVSNWTRNKRRSRCWEKPQNIPAVLIPASPRACQVSALEHKYFLQKMGFLTWVGAISPPPKAAPCATLPAGTTSLRQRFQPIRKINCFCFYISAVTEAKELEKGTLGSLHCPQVRIYRFSPSHGKAGCTFTPEQEPRVCTRKFCLQSRDFVHWTDRSILRTQEYF